ncbi:hypothetical protein C7E18_24620, partial [Stenotrophomonas maltophilia]
PSIPLNRSLRQEKGSFGGESLYWYQPDLGGQQRDPSIPLNRSLRQEKGSFGGESLYWYQPDLGGQQ